MIRQFTKMLTGEVRGMHNAAYLLGMFALMSASLAFLRDRFLAHTFGASLSLDVYYAAFRIPDLIFIMIASLVSAYVLIPEFTKRSRENQGSYIESIMVYFSVTIVAVSALAYVYAPEILSAFFPQLIEQAGMETLLLMTRIMLLQPMLLGASNILATIIQVRGRYVIYALSPLFYNLGIILGIAILYPIWGLAGLAWGVVLGALLHFLVALPSVLSDGFFVKLPRLESVNTYIRTLAISLPRTLALSANHLILFAFIALAGTLSVGSITVFTFAFNLQSVPVSIIGISYSVAAFPILAASYAAGRKEEFVGYIRQAMRHIIFWMIPAAGLLIVLRAQVVRVILGSGAFDWGDTRLTAAVFAILVVALVAQALMPLLARGYYATGRSWTPFFVNLVAAVFAVALAHWLVKVFEAGGFVRTFIEVLLRVSDVPGTEVLALPLAFASASILSLVTLAILFEIQFKGLLNGMSRILWESTAAAGIGGAVAYATLNAIGGFTEATTFLLVFLQGALAGIAGLLAVIATYILLRSRELQEVYKSIVLRVNRKQVVRTLSTEDELS